MSESATSSHPRRNSPHDVIEVSLYERIASMLLALLILVGSVAFCLLVAWLSRRVFYAPPSKPTDWHIEQVDGGTSDGIVGESMQMDSPTHHDINQESNIVEPAVQDTLIALLGTVSDSPADFDESAITETNVETDQRGARQTGDGRRPGRGDGTGRPGIPPQTRWEIRFDEGSTVEGYARILDFFHIELGILNGAGQVVYVTNLTKAKPDTRTGTSKNEMRLYMSWRRGKMKEADDELLRRAGVPTGKQVLQFYPEPVEQTLLNLEEAFRGRKADTIRKTRFGIRKVGNGYEFYVTDQTTLIKSY
ncbi:MAG TPA: hypothetical protein VND64_14000 [Pirellulales bacterium]|nr:hypothetical protein [Pirellulales bacterium]